jgi:hypothetical protein
MPGITWLLEVERYPHLAVAQPLAGDLWVNTIGEQVSGMGMPQVVEPRMSEPGALDDAGQSWEI